MNEDWRPGWIVRADPSIVEKPGKKHAYCHKININSTVSKNWLISRRSVWGIAFSELSTVIPTGKIGIKIGGGLHYSFNLEWRYTVVL